MSKTVVIHQPDFLPWLGFFDRLLTADLYIVLDHVQFVKRGWIHRDRIKTPRGPAWLTLTLQKDSVETPINAMLLASDLKWRKEHLNLIFGNYRHATFFKEIFPRLEALYLTAHEKLVDINIAGLDMLSEMLDVHVPRMYSSQMNPAGSSTALNVDLLQKAGATRYLSGVGARAYFDSALLTNAGIELEWQDFDHPVYSQLHGEFVPMLSSIDVLFNCGIDGARKILRGHP